MHMWALTAALALLPHSRPALLHRASSMPRASTTALVSPPAKQALLDAIAAYDQATAADGVPSVDFGVKGGELDGDSRAPRDLLKAGAFWAVSERVGVAADAVVKAVEEVTAANPTPEPTAGFGTAEGASVCPLHGRWRNVWTTAADATFSPESKRGGANVSNIVDAASGRTTNIIDFLPRDHPAFRATRTVAPKPPLESLNVVLKAKAVSPSRIELVFRFVKPRVKILGRYRTLIIPVPGPFITRILFFFRPRKKVPPAFFDVLYLDDDLRVHKTGQGNLFVQRRAQAPVAATA